MSPAASHDDEHLVLVVHESEGHRRAAFLCLHSGHVVPVENVEARRLMEV